MKRRPKKVNASLSEENEGGCKTAKATQLKVKNREQILGSAIVNFC